MTEEKAFFNLLEESFPGLKANINRCEKLGFPWASRPFLKEDNGEVVSHVGFLEYPMLIEGRWTKAGAIHAICTKSTHRRQGLASQLIQEALAWAKGQYELVFLFTEIPKFYEKLFFQSVQEYRFHLKCQHPKGTKPLRSLTAPQDMPLFLDCFQNRAPVSNHLWVKDLGTIASFNTLFATYPTFWSLHYSSLLHGIISFQLESKTLHLYDVIAQQIPSLDKILDHLPAEIDEIYFYFSPDQLTNAAVPEPCLHDNKKADFSGYLMVHGIWPTVKPFMISPLSRC